MTTLGKALAHPARAPSYGCGPMNFFAPNAKIPLNKILREIWPYGQILDPPL